ncbi:MAG: DNA cytosine methyltransferase [Bdellovibrionales bacterium]|nr:DNA cytosine methyltransferase [Bdellovibrionales bacterium]
MKQRHFRSFIKKKQESFFYYEGSLIYNILKKQIKEHNTIYQWRRNYVRKNKSNVCPTLTANMGTGGHNVPLIKDRYGIRKLTPRECIRFQGFPDTFKLPKIARSHLYKQIGNSVSVPVIKRIAKEMKKCLKNGQ